MGSIGGTWSCDERGEHLHREDALERARAADRLLAGCVGSWTTVIARASTTTAAVRDDDHGLHGRRVGRPLFADGVDTAGLMAAITGQGPNVETNEAFYPILYLYRRETTDSGVPASSAAAWARRPAGSRTPTTSARCSWCCRRSARRSRPRSGSTAAIRRTRRCTRCCATPTSRSASRGEIPTESDEIGGELEYLPAKSRRSSTQATSSSTRGAAVVASATRSTATRSGCAEDVSEPARSPSAPRARSTASP